MNSIYEFLERFKAFVYDALNKIENSPFYEQVFVKFESLEPSQQKTLTLGSRLLGLVVVLYFFVSPLMSLWQSKSVLDDQRVLLSDMKTFNTAIETRPRPAPNPSDWQNMPASTSDEAHQSLRSYMASIGLPEGSYQTIPSAGGQLQLDIPQINLRQVQTLLFQIDGWFPNLENEIVTIKTLQEDPQKLSLALTLNHRSGQVFSANPGKSSSGGMGNSSGASSRRSTPTNVANPDDELDALSPPPSYDGGNLDAEIHNEAPRSDYNDSESLPDFEAMDAASSMDSLPPPPPIEDEDF